VLGELNDEAHDAVGAPVRQHQPLAEQRPDLAAREDEEARGQRRRPRAHAPERGRRARSPFIAARY
jgi:hypothetical protein